MAVPSAINPVDEPWNSHDTQVLIVAALGLALIAGIIGIPMFFEIGLVLLIPIVMLAVRRTNTPAMRLGSASLHWLACPCFTASFHRTQARSLPSESWAQMSDSPSQSGWSSRFRP